MSSKAEPWQLENGSLTKVSHGHSVTAHSMSSMSLRQKSDLTLVSKMPIGFFRMLLANVQEVILGTKLSVLFPAIPLAILAQFYQFEKPWIFALSLLGLTPLAERVSFLTERIASYTGPTVGGLLNATCGNATELIIAIFALVQNKMDVVKYSLLGSILSNLLLVLGTSLLCGGLYNISNEQKFDRKQVDVNMLLLLLALLCHALLLMFQSAPSQASTATIAKMTLDLSRVSCIVMLFAYFAYLFFQLKTHRQLFEVEEENDGHDYIEEEKSVVGFWSGFAWLVGMTAIIALLSEYLVGTIETSAESWGISVSFLCIILLPIVGNAAEHAGAIIFAFRNKLDITMAVALGSATQITLFVLPLIVIVAWTMGISMTLAFSEVLDTGSLALAILVTAFTLQDGTSHYLKGIVLLLCYVVIAACFLVSTPLKDIEGKLQKS